MAVEGGTAPVDRRVAVAYVHRAKGVRGEVKAELLAQDPSRLEHLREVVVQKAGQPDRSFCLARWRAEQPGVLLKFDGVDSPEDARALLVGGYITVARDQVPPLPAGSFYEFELVGCQVEDEEGRVLGRIAEVHRLPTIDAYRVVGESGDFLLPAVADFVVEIAVDRGKVVVKGVDELISLT